MSGTGGPALDRNAMLAFLAGEVPGAGFGDGRLLLADVLRLTDQVQVAHLTVTCTVPAEGRP